MRLRYILQKRFADKVHIQEKEELIKDPLISTVPIVTSPTFGQHLVMTDNLLLSASEIVNLSCYEAKVSKNSNCTNQSG